MLVCDLKGASFGYGSNTIIPPLSLTIMRGDKLGIIGRNGVGPFCYGNGTNNQALAGTLGADGAHYCYDPTNGNKMNLLQMMGSKK